MSYTREDAPLNVYADDSDELLRGIYAERWLRKRWEFKGQAEYRLGWHLFGPPGPAFPKMIDLELTEKGLELFKPWKPTHLPS